MLSTSSLIKGEGRKEKEDCHNHLYRKNDPNFLHLSKSVFITDESGPSIRPLFFGILKNAKDVALRMKFMDFE